MMRLVVGVIMVGIVVAGSFTAARADTDVFGPTQLPDSSYDIRRTTTEVFSPIRGQSILNRPRPDYDPRALPIGSFKVFPSVDLGAEYNNNIFAQPSRPTDDFIGIIDPAVTVQSDWSRHALAFTASGDVNTYANNGSQDFSNVILQAEGRYDIMQQTWIAGAAGYQRVAELRGSPSTPTDQQGPSEYNLYSASADVNRSVGILKARAGYTVNRYEYSSLDLIGGGTVSQSNRDRTQNDVHGEVSYDISENLKPFAALGYNWRDYSANGARSSNGYKADIGARMDLGGITTAEAYIGYLQQDYYNFPNGRTDSIDFGANVLWNVTPLTSVEGRAARSIEEVTTGTAASYIASSGTVIVSHELLRYLILRGSLNYLAADYQGISEHDDFYTASGAARFLISRNLHTDISYGYQRKESTVPGINFDQHIVMLRLTLQY